MNGTYVDRLDCTGTKVRRHGMTLGDPILCQRNVPTTPILRKTHRISDQCDPVSCTKWERFHDVQGPLGWLLAKLYRVRLEQSSLFSVELTFTKVLASGSKLSKYSTSSSRVASDTQRPS